MYLQARSKVLTVLVSLTIISIITQIIFFIIHYHAVELVDSLVGASIYKHLLHASVIVPIISFLFIQLLAYVIFVALIWLIIDSVSQTFRQVSTYPLAYFFWLMGATTILTLNRHYYPDSFFSRLIQNKALNDSLLVIASIFLVLGIFCACYQFYKYRRYLILGSFFIMLVVSISLMKFLPLNTSINQAQHSQPNIIVIGLDSLRPDFISYINKSGVDTPHINHFLRRSTNFTEAYTPLARTFPAWISILTGKHPKKTKARVNLNDATSLIAQDTVPKELQKVGYFTAYATDEKRFSNITTDYGFDQVLGPDMGISDFLLGGLSDFPLTNLIVNLPLGRLIFPYNYSNRAAAITYDPNSFIQIIANELHPKKDKPLFLAVHFCLTHWPFTWANNQQKGSVSLVQRYRSSIKRVDEQFDRLLALLKAKGLLKNSWVILLSDHGTTLGLEGDRLINRNYYRGNLNKLHWVTVNKLSQTDNRPDKFKPCYQLNTSYGQGTDILSLKQYRVLLAFSSSNQAQKNYSNNTRVSLLDIAPTILDLINLPSIKNSDGVSLKAIILNRQYGSAQHRPFFLETGHSISEIETDHIKMEKVLRQGISLYNLDPNNGHIFVKPAVQNQVLASKQRAVLLGEWLLALYPASQRSRFMNNIKDSWMVESYILPAYYVLANVKTGEWTIGLTSSFAKKAPVFKLRKMLKGFYGEELDYLHNEGTLANY